MTMTMEKIKAMSNSELIELYADKVRCDHYDPCETPKTMKELYDAGISQEDIEAIILERMK